VPQISALRTFQVDRAVIEIYSSKANAGKAAALRGGAILKAAMAKEGRARLIMAAGNSQEDLVAALVQGRDLDWWGLEVFHMDEYINLPETNRGCLKRSMNTRCPGSVVRTHPRAYIYLDAESASLLKA
jgi:glucosamine-6-phosphate deaminase